jgi:hypothetical protein
MHTDPKHWEGTENFLTGFLPVRIQDLKTRRYWLYSSKYDRIEILPLFYVTLFGLEFLAKKDWI